MPNSKYNTDNTKQESKKQENNKLIGVIFIDNDYFARLGYFLNYDDAFTFVKYLIKKSIMFSEIYNNHEPNKLSSYIKDFPVNSMKFFELDEYDYYEEDYNNDNNLMNEKIHYITNKLYIPQHTLKIIGGKTELKNIFPTIDLSLYKD
jgi:hypothetical protein